MQHLRAAGLMRADRCAATANRTPISRRLTKVKTPRRRKRARVTSRLSESRAKARSAPADGLLRLCAEKRVCGAVTVGAESTHADAILPWSDAPPNHTALKDLPRNGTNKTR